VEPSSSWCNVMRLELSSNLRSAMNWVQLIRDMTVTGATHPISNRQCTLVSALTDAPAFNNIWTMSSWPLRHAMCKAVRPSCNAAFTRVQVEYYDHSHTLTNCFCPTFIAVDRMCILFTRVMLNHLLLHEKSWSLSWRNKKPSCR